MYARVTKFQADPSKLGGMAEQVDSITTEISGIAGLDVAYVAWRGDGAGSVTAIYESQQAAEAAAEQVMGVWSRLSEYLASPPSTETYDTVQKLA